MASYEWVYETFDDIGDIQDVDHSSKPGLPTSTQDVGLVRTASDGSRAWAYIEAGKLPMSMLDDEGNFVCAVPRKYIAQFAGFMRRNVTDEELAIRVSAHTMAKLRLMGFRPSDVEPGAIEKVYGPFKAVVTECDDDGLLIGVYATAVTDDNYYLGYVPYNARCLKTAEEINSDLARGRYIKEDGK